VERGQATKLGIYVFYVSSILVSKYPASSKKGKEGRKKEVKHCYSKEKREKSEYI
jgi:hypothetical protein